MASTSRIFEYFVVCGLGPEIRALDGVKGFHGAEEMYMPAFIDQFPHSGHALYPPPPPQLPTVSHRSRPFPPAASLLPPVICLGALVVRILREMAKLVVTAKHPSTVSISFGWRVAILEMFDRC
jgi:hypothetical protein